MEQNGQVVKEKSGCFFHFHTSFWHSIFRDWICIHLQVCQNHRCLWSVCLLRGLPFYNVRNVNFKISGCNILQKSVILSSHERLTNNNAERHGKSWIFRFFLGQLGAFLFSSECWPWLIESKFQSPWRRSENIPHFYAPFYWLAGCFTERIDFGAILRFQSAHLSVKPSSSEGFFCDPTLWGVKTWRKLSHVSSCFCSRCWS